LLAPLVAFAWFVRQQERKLQSMMLVFLDRVAKDWRLTKVAKQAEQRQNRAVALQPPSAKLQAPGKLQ